MTETFAPLSDAEPPTDPVGGYVLGEEIDYWTIPLEKRPFLFRNMSELTPYPTRSVRHGATVRALPQGDGLDLRMVVDGRPETLDSFMQRYHTAALIVVRDGRVQAERYRYGNTAASRWVMFSITKSIVATALAAAVASGEIASVDDPAATYVPALRNTAYDGPSIMALANMTSGVDRVDAYENPDPRTNPQELAYFSREPEAVHDYLRGLKRAARPGVRFNYNSMDSFVLGEVIAGATGMTVADYISEQIWKPAGMEDDAFMRLTMAGQEVCHGGLSATLRDIARFGLFALDLTVSGGGGRVPPGWFDAVSKGEDGPDGIRAPGCTDAAPDFGYARHWWTFPRGRDRYELGDDDGFAGLGLYGQQLYVVPRQRLVVALQSADVAGVNPSLFSRGRDLATALALHYRRV